MIYLKDLDDLYDEFNNQDKINDYQEFINIFIRNKYISKTCGNCLIEKQKRNLIKKT